MAVAFTGSSSFTRYYVVGDKPREYRISFIEQIQRQAFWEIEGTDGEESCGWVAWDDMTQVEFAEDICFRDEYLVLAMRMDQRRVPPAVLKLHVLQAEKVLLGERGQEQLGRAQRKELVEAVQSKLTRRIPPTPTVIDMVWNITRGILLLGSTSQGVMERFADLFTTTFRLGLRIAHPYAAGENLLSGGTSRERLEELRPAVFKGQAATDEARADASPDTGMEEDDHE